MIKGKYVATLTIEMAVAENAPNLLPFERITEAWTGMEAALKEHLVENLWADDDDIHATVKLETHSCHVEKTGEDDNDG